MAAEQGDINAQYALSSCYGMGWGVAMNLEESMRRLISAAEKGNYTAQLDLIQTIKSVEEEASQGSLRNKVLVSLINNFGTNHFSMFILLAYRCLMGMFWRGRWVITTQ